MESKTGIESRIITLIAQIQGKQTADFSSNFLDDEDAKAIAEAFKLNPFLQRLNFEFNEIGDEGVKAIANVLKTNLSLQTLNLGTNIFSDEGAISIAEALKSNYSLQTLSLKFNKIGNDGAKAIFDALETNISLIDIRLDSNGISKELLDKINKRLERNRRIYQTAYLSPFCITSSIKHPDSTTYKFFLSNQLYEPKLIGLIDSFVMESSPIAKSERKKEVEEVSRDEKNGLTDDTTTDDDAAIRWAGLESPREPKPPILVQFLAREMTAQSANTPDPGLGSNGSTVIATDQTETTTHLTSISSVSSKRKLSSDLKPREAKKARIKKF